MTSPRWQMAVKIVLVVCTVIVFSSLNAYSLAASSAQVSNPFEDFFNGLATAQGVEGSRGEAGYLKLMDSIGVMAPSEIAAGLPIIDRQIDNTAERQDRLAKFDAANLLMFISLRPDGPALLQTELDRLAFMLTDPTHFLSGQAAMALQHIGYSRPTEVWPILEAALKDPEINNKTGPGPAIAIILLRMGPHGDEVTKHIVQYMRRPDLTDNQLMRWSAA